MLFFSFYQKLWPNSYRFPHLVGVETYAGPNKKSSHLYTEISDYCFFKKKVTNSIRTNNTTKYFMFKLLIYHTKFSLDLILPSLSRVYYSIIIFIINMYIIFTFVNRRRNIIQTGHCLQPWFVISILHTLYSVSIYIINNLFTLCIYL